METFHNESEFHLLDFNSLIQGEYATNGDNYNFSQGGKYVKDNEWTINVFENGDFDNEHIWKIPTYLNRFINWYAKNSVKQFKSEVRTLFKAEC